MDLTSLAEVGGYRSEEEVIMTGTLFQCNTAVIPSVHSDLPFQDGGNQTGGNNNSLEFSGINNPTCVTSTVVPNNLPTVSRRTTLSLDLKPPLTENSTSSHEEFDSDQEDLPVESDSEEEELVEDEGQEVLPQQPHCEDLEIENPSSSIEQLCQPNGTQIVNEFPKILERLQSVTSNAAGQKNPQDEPFLKLVEAVESNREKISEIADQIFLLLGFRRAKVCNSYSQQTRLHSIIALLLVIYDKPTSLWRDLMKLEEFESFCKTRFEKESQAAAQSIVMELQDLKEKLAAKEVMSSGISFSAYNQLRLIEGYEENRTHLSTADKRIPTYILEHECVTTDIFQLVHKQIQQNTTQNSTWENIKNQLLEKYKQEQPILKFLNRSDANFLLRVIYLRSLPVWEKRFDLEEDLSAFMNSKRLDDVLQMNSKLWEEFSNNSEVMKQCATPFNKQWIAKRILTLMHNFARKTRSLRRKLHRYDVAVPIGPSKAGQAVPTFVTNQIHSDEEAFQFLADNKSYVGDFFRLREENQYRTTFRYTYILIQYNNSTNYGISNSTSK